MHALPRRIIAVFALLVLTATLAGCGGIVPNSSNRHNVPLSGAVKTKLANMGSSPSEPMMIRLYKESSELEVWKRTKGGTYKLFSTYEVCAWSGELGPKIKEGDRQAPEGFYTITPALLNPKSSYYLSFNTGFPNKFDRAYGRTGSDLMVHGDCTSRGCFAMTDDQIKEIYALARESFAGGNPSFQLQLFPFRMTPQNLAKHADSPNMSFWQNIKEGHDRFELTKTPPSWDVCNKQYVFDVPTGVALDARAACPPGAIVRTAALESKQAADAKAIAEAITASKTKAANEAAAKDKAEKEKAAAAARGEAIGSFIGGLFGNDGATKTVTDPAIVAPRPMPPIKRG